MYKTILFIILVFSFGVFAQAGRTTVTTGVNDWHKEALDHAYLFFEDSSATITATANTWYTITNAKDSLWGEKEVDGFTHENDSLYAGKAGHYEGIAAIFFVGSNNDTYQARILFNSAAISKAYVKIAGDTANVYVPYFLEGVAVGDTVLVQIRNTKNGNDPTIVGGIHKVFFLHD